jgi:hypothetical protein
MADTLWAGLREQSTEDGTSGFERLAEAILPLVTPCLSDERSCRHLIAELIDGEPTDHVVENLFSRVKALRRSF